MTRRRRPHDEPELFDLPLSDEPLPPPVPPAKPAAPPPVAPPEPPIPAAEQEFEQALFPESTSTATPWLDEGRAEAAEATPARVVDRPEEPAGVEPSAPHDAPPQARLVAGLLDLGVLVAVGIAVWAGLRWMGIRTTLDDWPATLTFHAAFSFLYFVLPLAFWGRTPGMARTGLVARTPGGNHLSFGQSVARWIGACLTGVLLGLPLLLSFTGRSLSDRLSGSRSLTG